MVFSLQSGSWRQALLISFFSLIAALLIGAILILAVGHNPVEAYQGLLQGSLGNAKGWAATMRKMTPFILAGLSVAVAFRAGMFNIGAAGQYLMGTILAVWVGVNFGHLPAPLHLSLAITAGMAGGLTWGLIPGLLKVTTGAHEVITTIMLNYIAALFTGWTVYAGSTQRNAQPGPLWDPAAGAISESRDILASAQIPWLFGPPYRVHYGILLALLAAFIIWWLLERSVVGFEIKTVGQNPGAARYAGMRVRGTIVLAMGLAGILAGLAGAIETLGLNHKFAPEFGGGVGFDGITIALLGQTHPLGIVLASFLFGLLDAGAAKMQFESGVSVDIIQIIQGLILVFVAAPALMRQAWRFTSRQVWRARMDH